MCDARAVQGARAWGKSPAMPPSRLQPLYPDRRRRRGASGRIILLVLLVLFIGFIIYLSTMNTEVPTRHIEQDVTNDLPKS